MTSRSLSVPRRRDTAGASSGAMPDIGLLYHEHHGWLFNWLRRKLLSPQDAADLSHDTFLRLITGGPARIHEPRAYLLVIASRLLINRNQRQRIEREALYSVAVLLEGTDRRGPEQVAGARDLLSRVLHLLLEELPDKPRRAFLMARLEGLSYRAIGERLAVSESSVKQYLARCLAHCHWRLHDALEQGAGQ
ncbi:sigma-70 family RNA polymerase sigma factor [Alloalcanivorax profundimaris]|uniref:sigma-70 family RNA polymerase sigma factor n=1 Tax=Alloalcanivorax profundimaris TaxID=2735259 RepID=UPI001E33B7C2|nr:sigma-70 family RNA polymerase sigma factor [Alloalcanivorax profundimaris]MCQ6263640.1 sigma-70 family RNA polymerase sigma factor [Alcanivorax sp. MM125-6]